MYPVALQLHKDRPHIFQMSWEKPPTSHKNMKLGRCCFRHNYMYLILKTPNFITGITKAFDESCRLHKGHSLNTLMKTRSKFIG